MSDGYGRNARLARAAMVTAAGGALVGVTQRAPELAFSPWGKALLLAGGVVIVAGLVSAVLSFRRGQGE